MTKALIVAQTFDERVVAAVRGFEALGIDCARGPADGEPAAFDFALCFVDLLRQPPDFDALRRVARKLISICVVDDPLRSEISEAIAGGWDVFEGEGTVDESPPRPELETEAEIKTAHLRRIELGSDCLISDYEALYLGIAPFFGLVEAVEVDAIAKGFFRRPATSVCVDSEILADPRHGFIVDALNQLMAAGVDLELSSISKSDASSEVLTRADIFIDPTPFRPSRLALRAMAGGCAIMGRYAPYLVPHLADMPYLHFDQSTFRDRLQSAVHDAQSRLSLAVAARDFVESHCDPADVARRVLACLDRASGEDFDYFPNFYCGLDFPLDADAISETTAALNHSALQRFGVPRRSALGRMIAKGLLPASPELRLGQARHVYLHTADWVRFRRAGFIPRAARIVPSRFRDELESQHGLSKAWRHNYEEFHVNRAKSLGSKPSLADIAHLSGRVSKIWGDEQRVRFTSEDIVARLGVDLGSSVLEVGCAAGLLAINVAQKVARYLGIDVNEQAIDVAQTLGIANARFAVGDAMALDFSDSEFDAAYCFALVRNFPSFRHIIPMLEEMLRVVRPGGRVLVGEINDAERRQAREDAMRGVGGAPTYVAPSALAEIPDIAAPLQTFYRKEQFQEFAEQRGLDCEVHPMDAQHFARSYLFNVVFTKK